MKKFFTALATVLVAGLTLSAAAPRSFADRRASLQAGNEAFKWAPKSAAADKAWAPLSTKGAKMLKTNVKTDSDFKMELADAYDYIDMPDGRTWFVLVNIDSEPFGYATAYTGYEVKVFD